jgi:integrase
LPEVLSRDEVRSVLAQAAPGHQLPLRLLYGTGMRLLELLRLRVNDVDFGRNQIITPKYEATTVPYPFAPPPDLM